MLKRICLVTLGLLLIVSAVSAQGYCAHAHAPAHAPTRRKSKRRRAAWSMWRKARQKASRRRPSACGNRVLQPPTSETARIILIIGGIILLVAGWAVYDFIILIAGFLIGGLIALSFFNEPNTVIALAVFVVGGLIGAALAAVLWFLAVFLIGGYIGIVLTRSLAVALGFGLPSDIVLLIALIVGGVLLLLISFELLIVFSAIVGAQMVALGFGLEAQWVILLAILGIVLQIVITRSRGVAIRRRPRSVLWRRRAVV